MRTSRPLYCGRTPGAHRGLAALLAVCVALVFAMAFAATPASAHAKSYDCPKVDIVAQAQTDASLHVVEQRMFDFDGDFTAVWWTFSDLPKNADLVINSLRMAQLDSDGNVAGDWQTLEQVSFQIPWREAGGPGRDAWSFDRAKDTVYAFFDQSDTRVIFELDYTVAGGVQAYDDIAEIYWKYIPEGWDVSSQNVTARIELPVASGAEVVPGENVRAWGHGPLDGVVEVAESGEVTYEVPYVRAGQYAEARIVFPVSWLTNLDPAAALAHQGTTRLDAVIAEEKAWADEANNQRIIAFGAMVALILACVAALAVAALLFIRYGREHKPDFTDDYWRDVPEKGMQPAVMGRLWRWNHESPDDFTATVMSLAHKGALHIDKGSYPDRRGKMVDDYYLTVVEPVAGQLTDPLEIKTLDVLINEFAAGNRALWLGTIRKFGEDHPQRYADLMAEWQGQLTAEVNKRDFFEARSKHLQTFLGVLSGLFIVGGIASVVVLANFIPVIFMAPTGIALAVIANYMPRRTVEGNNITARAKALRNWLKDFSSLDERPPTDVKVWGEFMVYAYLFGVAEQAMRELRHAVPELFVEEADAYTSSYVPWYVWYSAGHGAGGVGMPSFSDMLNTSVANTLSSAQAAISAANAEASGAGGFGGGFSGGGGGGFGGGGGAR